MEDRELLERAAKVAGVFITKAVFETECTSPWDPDWEPIYSEESNSMHGWRTWYGAERELGGWEGYEWRPLADDGDAMRLVTACGISLDFIGDTVIAVTYGSNGKKTEAREEYSFKDGEGWGAATRRAIVRAAAGLTD